MNYLITSFLVMLLVFLGMSAFAMENAPQFGPVKTKTASFGLG